MRDIIPEERDTVFFDVGANVGHHALFMSKCSGFVHAFEPYDVVLNALKQKIAANGLKNIFVHAVGLGSANEELEYFAPTGSNIATGTFAKDHDVQNNEKYGTLQVVKGDDYIIGLDLNRVDLIKIDVEGYEGNVLQGLRETIHKYRPIIFMEFSKTTRAAFTNFSSFQSLFPGDYSIWKVKTNTSLLYFFNRPKYRLMKFDFNEIDVNIAIMPG